MKYLLILLIAIVGLFFGSLLWKLGSITNFDSQPIAEYRVNILAYWFLTVLFGIAEVILIKLYKEIKNG